LQQRARQRRHNGVCGSKAYLQCYEPLLLALVSSLIREFGAAVRGFGGRFNIGWSTARPMTSCFTSMARLTLLTKASIRPYFRSIIASMLIIALHPARVPDEATRC